MFDVRRQDREDETVHWRATFAPTADSARRARAGLAEAVDGRGVPAAFVGDALLVLGELAGNAVRHARTEFTVCVTLADGKLRLEVFDRDTRLPSLSGVDVESTSGRGLQLVSAIATHWGAQRAEDAAGVSGKVVWAELCIAQKFSE